MCAFVVDVRFSCTRDNPRHRARSFCGVADARMDIPDLVGTDTVAFWDSMVRLVHYSGDDVTENRWKEGRRKVFIYLLLFIY